MRQLHRPVSADLARGLGAPSRIYALGMWRRLLVAVVTVGAVAAAGSAQASDPWKPLYRPLRLLAMASDGSCPVSAVATANFRKYGVAPGIGRGPAYPVGFEQPGSVLRFEFPPSERSVFAGSEWSGQKVLWFVSPSYRGRLLIRGGRIDAAGELRFNSGQMTAAVLRVPSREIRIAVGLHGGNPAVKLVGQRYRPSFTRVQTAGCYAYQIDGTTFSRAIVFSASAVT